MASFDRYRARQYGKDWDNWCVEEVGEDGQGISIITWLCEPQANEIARCLNDACGLDWQIRHPDWWLGTEALRREQHETTRVWWHERVSRKRTE